MVKKKKLNLEVDLFGDKEYEKNAPIEISDSVTLYSAKKITNRKIDKIITELMEVIQYAKSKDYSFPTSDLDVLNYLKYLIFKHFTNMEEAVATTDYYRNIEVFAKAYNKGWISKVLDELPKSEVEKVEDKFGEVYILLEELNAMPEDEQEKFVKELKKLEGKLGMYRGEKVVTHNGEKIIPQT